jgi:polynucleotide 5'-hydroxyl-kinase GRC3/NOL9
MLDEWVPHIEEITSSPGVTVVVGAADAGKTSFCTLLANHAVSAGLSTAVVDGDMGQTEIGPPTTIGLGLMESEIDAMSNLSPHALYFVGSTTPVSHLLATVTGVKKLTEKALALGRHFVIVNTTGLVRGSIARRLKTHKMEILSPRHIVALQTSDEAEHFLRLFDTWEGFTVHRLPVSPHAHAKSPALRAQRRGVRFMEYFAKGSTHEIDLADITTSGTWLHTGTPMETRYIKFAEKALGTTVYHGERVSGGIYLVTAAERTERGIRQLQEQFGTKSIVLTPASRYANLIVGLYDSALEVLELGIVRRIDFRAGMVTVYTPLRSIAPVRSVRLGDLKVRPNGTEIGLLRPGEL